jgi:hypothetical protein
LAALSGSTWFCVMGSSYFRELRVVGTARRPPHWPILPRML